MKGDATAPQGDALRDVAAETVEAVCSTDAARKIMTEMPDLPFPLEALVKTVYDERLDLATEAREVIKELETNGIGDAGRAEQIAWSAEGNARRAHRLYIHAQITYNRFEVDSEAVIGAMWAAATADLQKEKDLGQRKKAITDADVRERCTVMFPDEWRRIQDRRSQAEGTLNHIKRLADLAQSRCYTVSNIISKKR